MGDMEKKKPFKIPAYMSPEQISAIKDEIRDIKDMMTAADENRRGDVGYFQHSGKHIVDPQDVQKAIAAREIQLRKLTPQKFTGEQANKAYAKARELRAWIERHMPRETFVRYPSEKDPVSKVHDFEKAVQRQVEWQQKGQKVIDAYHYLMRRIDPDAPREDFNRLVRERA
jgi:hypothetical protein